jgi:hypothetical protein
MTDLVDHTRDHDLTVYGQQATCFSVLYRATVRDGLPALHWVISDIDLPGDEARAVGQAWRPAGLEDEQRALVCTWAEAMRVPVSERPSQDDLHIEAEGFIRGLRVRVWAALETTPKAA